jgi:hypothetical protein
MSGLALEGTEHLEKPLSGERKGQIRYEYHDVPLGGHRGMNRTHKAIKENYSWPNMKQEIEEYVKRCRSCQINKVLAPEGRHPWKLPLRHGNSARNVV